MGSYQAQNVWSRVSELTSLAEKIKMAHSIAGRQYNLRVNTSSSPSNQYQYFSFSTRTDRGEETEDSEDEVDNLPTPLKNPRLPQRNQTTGTGFSGPLNADTPTLRPQQPFVAKGDIPKKRFHSTGYNFIRPKDEPGTTSITDTDHISLVKDDSTQPESSKTTRTALKACSTCRAKRTRCTHKKAAAIRKNSRTSVKPEVKIESKPNATSYRVKKDGTLYTRTPYDRSQGPSMTPNAVDYRERKVIQQEYQDQLTARLDAAVVQQVESEGGITPLGRLFKAAVRTIELMQAEKAKVNPDEGYGSASSPNDYQYLVDQNNMLREAAGAAEMKLFDFKQKVQGLVDEV